MRGCGLCVTCCLVMFFAVRSASAFPDIRLSEWERGVSVDSTRQPEMRVYIWFYEWHMFDAVTPGQHTRGNWTNRAEVTPLKARLVNGNPGVELDVKALDDGAELKLTVTNRSKHDWPELASMVACFNPGPEKTRNRQFANTKTWFHSADGLKPLAGKAPREIHYNHALRKLIDKQADAEGRYSWSSKWPRSDAVDGLIIRESTDGRWVTGIAWDPFLAAQGHNPWECMHLSVRVGPLKRGETRTVKGRVYLFEGKKEDLLKRHQKEQKRED
jgi:hypothetical protein